MALSEQLDPELPVVEAICEADRDAFEDFVRRHDRWVRGVIYGVLGDAHRVEDVAQQVWSAVWQQARKLQDLRRWRSWLYRLARNAAMDAGREISRRRRFGLKLRARVEEQRRTRLPQADVLLDTEQRHAIMRALQELPALYREPFVLRHLEGWSYQQIAGLLEMPVDTVETRLVRARRQLREALRGKL